MAASKGWNLILGGRDIGGPWVITATSLMLERYARVAHPMFACEMRYSGVAQIVTNMCMVHGFSIMQLPSYEWHRNVKKPYPASALFRYATVAECLVFDSGEVDKGTQELIDYALAEGIAVHYVGAEPTVAATAVRRSTAQTGNVRRRRKK